jgi:two-component system CheB/CheR fusion protein
MPNPVESAPRTGSESEIEHRLSEELEATRNELNSTIHEMEASNEDLKESNEEILSMNEELQSTNEELETSKEELQSLNEELTTVNSELENKLKELETAHNDLNNLFASTQIATLFLDRALRIKRFTPAIKDLLNLIDSDIGRPLADITLKFDDPNLEADAENVLADLRDCKREVWAHSGTWYLRRILPYRTHDDTISGVVITFADVSEVKRAAITNRESERRLEMALGALDGGLWEIPIDPGAPRELPDSIYLSSRFKGLLGFEDDQFPNSLYAWQQRIVPADRQAFTDALRSRDNTPSKGVHYRIHRRDGHIRWFASYGTVYSNTEDDQACLIGIDCDITAFKQGDIAAHRIQAQLELLANAEPMMILFVNNQRRVAFSNTAYRDWFGFVPEDSDRHGLAAALGESAAVTLESYADTALAGRAISCELDLAHDGDEKRVLKVNLVPHQADGEVLGFYALMYDVSARGRRKSDRMQRQSGLLYLQRMASIGEMLSTIAHDVRQPLSAITTYAGALTRMLHAGKPAEETTPILRKIADQVGHASAIIDNTRDFVGARDYASSDVDLNDLVHRSLALTEGAARKANIQRRIELHTPLPATQCHAVQIEQVLINLINNAHDAMGGIDRDQRTITLKTSLPDPEHVQITIADIGEGIPIDKIGAIFEVFYTSKLDGMGMGLALSRTIAEDHDGQLWAESEQGHGATFYLKLPIVSEPEQPETGEPQEESPAA